MAAIQKKTHLLADVLTVQERHELLDEPGPVRVLSVVETRMQNGAAMPRRRNPSELPTATMEGGQSLISTATERHITQVIVLIDRAHAAGKTIHQLADYAVMRVFARTRDAKGRRCAGVDPRAVRRQRLTARRHDRVRPRLSCRALRRPLAREGPQQDHAGEQEAREDEVDRRRVGARRLPPRVAEVNRSEP